MSKLDDAKLPSLKEKILAEAEEEPKRKVVKRKEDKKEEIYGKSKGKK